MSFGSAPGGTTVGSAQYVVGLDTQAMLAALAQLEETTRTSSQQVVQSLSTIAVQEQAVAASSTQMASTVTAEMSQLETSMRNIGGLATSTAEGFKSLAATAVGLAGFTAVGFGIAELDKQFKETITDTVNFGKEVIQLQRVMGGTTEQASAFAAVFDRFGIDTSTATVALTALSRALVGLDDAQDKTTVSGLSATAALKALGVETENTNGTLKSTQQAFLDVIDALHEQGNGFQTTEEARAIFGRGFQGMLPIIALGSEGFQKLAEDAKEMGVSLTGQNLDAVKQYIVAQKDMNEAMEGLRLTLGEALLPAMAELAKSLTELAKQINGDSGQSIKNFTTDMRDLVGVFKEWTGYLQDDLDFLTRIEQSGVQIHNAIGDFFGELGRVGQASDAGGNVDLNQLGQLDAAAAEQRSQELQAQAIAKAQAFNDARAQTADPETDAGAIQQRQANNQALEKTIEENLKQRASAVKDEAQAEIDSLREQETANQRSYDAQLAALNRFKDEATRENEASHKVALDNLQSEEDATKKSYDAQILAAEIARDHKVKANQDAHDAALKQIEDEKKAAEDASKERVSTLEEHRNAEFANIDAVKQAQLQALANQEQATRDTRTQQDRDLQDARQQEDRDAQSAHQAELDRLKTEHDTAVQRYADERAEIEKTKQAALDAIQAETDAESQQHDATLQRLRDEQAAAQAQHDQTRQNLQDEQQAAQDAHDQRVRQLQDAQAAQEDASQAAQDALRAQLDEESKQHDQRLADIDAESKAQQTALQQQLAALSQQQTGATFADQQAKLQQAVAQAQTGVQIASEIAQNTGDPNTVLAAQKALADAQAALDKANADREVQLQKDAINQQISDLKDQTDAKKNAEDEQYQAQKDRVTKEIADEQARLKAVKDSIAQQIQAANEQLTVIRNDLQQQQRANDDALANRLANIQKEQRAEDDAFKAFQQTEANKRKEVTTTATAALDNVQTEADTEQKAYAASTTAVNTRYATEQQRVADTRRLQDRAIQDNRTEEDRDFAAHKQGVEDEAKHDHDQIDTLYNNPKTGLIAIEKNALAETLADLAQRKTEADATYKAEQDQIEATYNAKDTGLIPRLQQAWTTQKEQYDLRKADIDATYQKEKDRIFETFDKDTGDPATSGLIPNLTNAFNKTKQSLEDQVTSWQKWQQDVSKEIQTAIENLQKLIDKVHELNNAGKTPIREGPQPVEGEAQGNVPGQTSDQGGQRGPVFGGPPISLEQFSTDKDSILARFGVSTEQAACGPIAAEALARLYGHGVDMADILQYAQQQGLWDTQNGMHGGGSWVSLAKHFGVNIEDQSEQAAQAALSQGIPIVINTPNHYFVAQGYDPSTGTYDMGFSGQSAYGRRYLTKRDIESLAGGSILNFYEPTGGLPSGGSSSVQSGTTTISVPALGINFDVDAPLVNRVQVGNTKVPGRADQIAWRDFISNFAPSDLSTNLDFLKIVEAGALAESGLDPSRVQQGLPYGQAAKGLFQFDPGGMGAGVPDTLLFDPNYEASHILPVYANAYLTLLPRAGSMTPAEFASLVAATAERPLGYDDPSSIARRNYAAAFDSIQAYAAGGIIPEPTALLRLRDLQPYAIAGEVGPERVAPLGDDSRVLRGMVESTVHNWYGVTPESVVRQMQDAQRRERLLRGR